MPLGMEIVTGFATAPGVAASVALTMAAGDSLQVKATAAPNTDIFLLSMWAQNQVAGSFRVHSPKMHDNVQGIRVKNNTGDELSLFPRGIKQRLFSQDILTAEITGSAVGGQIEQASLLIWYKDIIGISANLIDAPTLASRLVNVFAVESALAPGALGGYSGSKAINLDVDLFKANTSYALIGYHVTAQATSIGIRGPDTGNLRVGGPCDPIFVELTEDWFRRLSIENGLPTIPVINSANKANTFIDCAQNQAAGAVTVDLIMGELTPQ